MTTASIPYIHSDQTITAIVLRSVQQLATMPLLTLLLPGEISAKLTGGCYFLARCGVQTDSEREENWQFYLRRPLFAVMPAATPIERSEKGDVWEFTLAGNITPGDRWLAGLAAEESVNLLGPLGQGFMPQPLARNLLLLAKPHYVPLLLGAIDPILNRGGRVALLLHTEGANLDCLRSRLPIPVELRLAATENDWQQHLIEMIPWADHICAALPNPEYQSLAHVIRRVRFRLDASFAQVFVQADLACGVGACLACVTPLPDGSQTRVCMHGPVFDLVRLAGRG